MKELFMQVMSNNRLVLVISGILIFALTQLLKMPIKHFTNKIKNERWRRIANITIMFIPFALGIGLEYLYSTYIYHDAVNLGFGVMYGTSGVSIYSLVERFLKVKMPNPYETEEGEAVLDFVEAVFDDGEIDDNDKGAVEEFVETVCQNSKDYEKDVDAVKAFWERMK